MKSIKSIICMLLLMLIVTQPAEAGGSRGGSHASHSSHSSSHSSSSRSTHASVNASRINAVSRMNTTSRLNSTSIRSQSMNASKAATLARPMRINFKDPVKYRTAHNQYVNNQIFYGVYYGNAHSVYHQKNIIKQQLLREQAYTIEVQHNGVRRLYVVSKEVYDAVNKGDTVHIKNGVVSVKAK
ncbi:hypothetical protein ROU88_05865 [Macrococcus capreoli]|uniref:hypothetical protein n=1 Tax=Macrococcus capreoli TaxID=2982690 RepID=UPI0021D5FCA7|nr:hypothetical protein [Macrococcus sp. TMW 2.2395]MCU7556886.1 hypothetical protein [Macrococcus sp. TMW 2.2395]